MIDSTIAMERAMYELRKENKYRDWETKAT